MEWQKPEVETVSEQDLLRQVAAHAGDNYINEKNDLEGEGEVKEETLD